MGAEIDKCQTKLVKKVEKGPPNGQNKPKLGRFLFIHHHKNPDSNYIKNAK